MDQQIVLATVWVTIWNSYCKKMYIDTVRNFTGDKNYVEAMLHLRKKAKGLGYNVKVGRKYISLIKEGE
tara:strand:+ start:3160 stop:3366 length:207 start_codon:yes stop_codon:yes gene_type:complete